MFLEKLPGIYYSRIISEKEFKYMKYKLLLLLLTTFLFVGCGQTTEKENLSDTESQATESIDENAVSSSAETSSAGDSQESEEEPFILTFEATTIDSEEVTSDIFASSKLTMLNVWATYCNPCLSEMPDLGEIAAEYDPTIFQIYGIISDVVEGDEAEKIEEAQGLITETGANYPHILLNQSLYSNLVGGVSGVPTTFFFNQDSELLGYLVGAQSKDTWVAIIEDLLSEME